MDKLDHLLLVDLLTETTLFPLVFLKRFSSFVYIKEREVSKWFYDTSTGAATGATRCGSFARGAQIVRGVGYPGIRWT
jgi:hypothetical protein